MNVSFLSTIAFGLLALTMIFAANLIGWIATGSAGHQLGVALAIAATAGSYLAQSNFTSSAEWLSLHMKWTEPNYAGPADPDAWAKHRKRERNGTILQMASISAGAISAICFILGSL